VDKQNRVWVADRENSRIQIFDAKGKFLEQWEDVFRPTGVCLDEDGVVYVSELCLRVSIFTPKGRLLARWGTEAKQKLEDALFVAPHAIALDSRGDLYVGDVAWTSKQIDRGPRVIQKFARKTR
jgi:sugar lactone lactonase YvrE